MREVLRDFEIAPPFTRKEGYYRNDTCNDRALLLYSRGFDLGRSTLETTRLGEP